MRLPSFYFNWLQKDNPTGTVEKLPQLHNKYETSVDGVYCVGDLTGIPLIKLAAESGNDLIERLMEDRGFEEQRQSNEDNERYDIVIIGAGPAGIAAGISAKKHKLRYTIIESSQLFSNIVNFPKNKPIYVTPAEPAMRSDLRFSDGTKETLLEELTTIVESENLDIHEGEMTNSIKPVDGGFTVQTSKSSYKALRVIIAIGKSGNERTLNVPGEKLPKVFSRLIDPGEHHDQDIMVVGGGDSAVEAAVALAKAGNRVALSYRRSELARPKEQNVTAFNKMVQQGAITPLFETKVKEIKADEVVLDTPSGTISRKNDVVFTLIGTEFPYAFFRRNNIRLEGDKSLGDYMGVAALLFFSSVLYFGKSAPVKTVSSFGDFFSLPMQFLTTGWPGFIKGFLAWIGFLGIIVTGGYMLFHLARNYRSYFRDTWQSFKYTYYISLGLLFTFIYLGYNLRGTKLLGFSPGTWYTAMYSVTIVIFGFRRMWRKPTGYIKRQTALLMAIQVIPLFILPVFIFPWLGDMGLFDGWIAEQVFPGKSYWRAYGFILAWPLFIHNLVTDQPLLFWIIVCLVQTFVLIPLIVYKWGKGAYCGWICSCGALAETLGDEYRTQAPHGPTAKRTDNVGQVVLWFAGILALAVLLNTWGGFNPGISGSMKKAYTIIVDILFAGVLGVGVYFFLSGRVWCRFLCPLAALMHIYARFSPYRIMSNKKRCISCNICTKVCHMGIDVMGYANKGIPMNDVECVRCSACVVNCPMQVLTFGNVGKKPDLDNTRYLQHSYPMLTGWQNGLSKEDTQKRIEEEKQRKEAKDEKEKQSTYHNVVHKRLKE